VLSITAMRPFVLVLVLVLAGCWTGGEPSPRAPETPDTPRPHARDLEITVERTMCFGACPVWKMTIHRDGKVEWLGEANVAAIGARERKMAVSDVATLDHELDVAKVFERDKFGHLPVNPTCTHSGSTTSCSFASVTICSDTSHTILTVRRDGATRRIDDSHCSDDDPALDVLEERIVTRARVLEWIGR
jgi:uncharacterized protein DUF6438